MLKMPTIHTPPPVQSYGTWQSPTTQLDTLVPQNVMAPTVHEPAPRLGLFRSLTFATLLTSFVALSGCDYVDKLLGKNSDPKPMEPADTGPKAIPESAFTIGKSRKVRRRPEGKYARRLERQAYKKAMKALKRETRRIVNNKFPVDCQRASKYTQEIDWKHSRPQLLQDAKGRYYYRYKLLWRRATCLVYKSTGRGKSVELSFTAHNPVLR